ncbi:M3 family metallopeptidase [Hymenobacter psoromatis]|uniref:M3 family metallopeptidase n=1 Tax=Hymenobacter psoromatis TaxID=1484116 RepID=UPI001CBA8A36|nr:M3 family metallopeptidase [Hymenobacter psoromatis]
MSNPLFSRTLALALAALTGACGSPDAPASRATTAGRPQPARGNPLLVASSLPYQAPDFAHLTDRDFQPALAAGLRQQRAELARLADNPAAPTFDNTLVALEGSGRLLNRVTLIFNQLLDAQSTPTLRQTQEVMAPELAASQDAIYLNPKLFQRVEAVYAQRAELALDSESAFLLTYYHQQFMLAGAALPAPARQQLQRLNQQEARLMARFSQKVSAASAAGAVRLRDSASLAGLSASERRAAARPARAHQAASTWLLPLENFTQQSVLLSLTKRAVRQRVFAASWTRAERGDSNDTRTTIARLAALRAAQAHLVGFKNYATWKLRTQMAQSPAVVAAFLGQLVPAATAKARQEATALQALVKQQREGFPLQPWDWQFYARQLRQRQAAGLSDDALKPYLELNNVLRNGLFYAANQLYGITFRERPDLPVYQPDMRVFEVREADGRGLGLFYCDLFQRDNKRGGGWSNSFVDQSTLWGTRPVVYISCNFPKPPPGQPALLTPDNITTLFHETGHALHRLFSNQRYRSLSAANVASDFVEFPSQFNEHWAFYPAVVQHYAVHFQTKAALPPALLARLTRPPTFGQGYAFTEALADDELDMQWHTLAAGQPVQPVDSFEAAALRNTHVYLPQVPPRYRSSYFRHIWADGYAAGYYAYAWSEMLDDDAYAWFRAHGGLTRANGQRFRDLILARGHTRPYGELFRAFCGHAPTIAPLLANRGLTGGPW